MFSPQIIAESNSQCRRITRRSGSTFRFAFRVLPHDQREAMHALYAFFRRSDDIGDDERGGSIEERKRALADWRRRLLEALQGEYSHPIHAALHFAVVKFEIPSEYLTDVLDGVESDLGTVAFENQEQLLRYCYRVASSVGLACIRVWGLQAGFRWNDAEPLAIRAGYAFQLTNILRDLSEDAAKGRCYLPTEDLRNWGVTQQDWLDPSKREQMRGLLQFQTERARGYYAESAELVSMLQSPGRAMFGLMMRAYEGVLDRIERSGCEVLNHRIRLGAKGKIKLLMRMLLGKY